MPFNNKQINFRRRTPRFYARHLALEALSWLRANNHRKLGHTPRVQFLCFHHVFSDEEDAFRRLLKHMMQQYEVVSYSEAVTRIQSSRIETPTMAISFDDGFHCCLRAAEILQEYGLSACFFLPPAILDCETNTDKVRFCQERLLIDPVNLMNRSEVDKIQLAGMEIGFHTRSHPRVSELASEDYEQEFKCGLEQLEKQVGKVNHFAWPFGKVEDFSHVAYEYLLEMKFTSIASCTRGCHLSGPQDGAMPILFRDPTEAYWPLHHIDYFLLKNVTNSKIPIENQLA